MTEAGKPAGTSKIYALVLVATLLVAAEAAGKGKPDPNRESLAAYLAVAGVFCTRRNEREFT